MEKQVRARMAPSPTGKLHIGTAHTTLFNFLFARHNKGTFILRIDDSDPIRSKPEFEKDIIESLTWLGLNWDEGPYHQSDNTKVYEQYIQKLIKMGRAYKCYCSKEELEEERQIQIKNKQVPHYSGKCRNLTEKEQSEKEKSGIKPVIRFKLEPKVTAFDDMVRGHIEVDMSQFGDFVIARSDGSPLLNFAVVVDDIELKITHIIRGEDFLNATPFQIQIYEALGVKPPEIANLSFIYAPDHTKLSKRHGAMGVTDYRELGYLPEALINFLALLGWNPGDDREIFSLTDLINEFDIKRVQKSAPTFNKDKLDWFNSHYIKEMSDNELSKRITEFFKNKYDSKIIEKVTPLIKDRIKVLKDFENLAGFFFNQPKLNVELFGKDYKTHLEKASEVIENLKIWNLENLNDALMDQIVKNSFKTGDFFMDLRIAITGTKFTPPINDSIIILGKNETLNRLKVNLT